MHITTSNILDTWVQFHVDNSGNWTARANETILATADSLKRCRRLARLELKKKQVRVAVPFTMIDPTTGKLTEAIARGRHASMRGRALIWINDGTENGRNDSIDLYWYSHPNNRYLRADIPKKQLDRIAYLFEEKRKTEDRLTKIEELITKWREDHTLDLGKTLDEALAEAAEAMKDNEPDQDTGDEDIDTDADTNDPVSVSEDDMELELE